MNFNESLSYFQQPQLQSCISATKDECWAMDSPIYPHLSGDVEDLATSPHILRASQKDLDLVPNLAPVSDVADEVNLSSNDTEIDLDPGVELEGIFTDMGGDHPHLRAMNFMIQLHFRTVSGAALRKRLILLMTM